MMCGRLLAVCLLAPLAVAAVPARAGGPDLVPGGFYSFYADGTYGNYTDLELISPTDGAGTYVFTVFPEWTPPLPAPVAPPGKMFFPSPFGLSFNVDGSMYTFVSWLNATSDGFLDPTWQEPWSQLARVDTRTGVMTYIGEPVALHYAGGEIDGCGSMYVTGFSVGDPATYDPVTNTFTPNYIFGDSNLYRVTLATGARTLIGDTGRTDWMDLAFDAQGRLWATTKNELWQIDTATAKATFVTAIHGVPQEDPRIDPANEGYMEVMTIAFSSEGKSETLWATAMRGFSYDFGNAPVMTIDTRTGNATLVGWTDKAFNHGGDTMPTKVKVCHRTGNGKYNPITVALEALPAHRAHGDLVPGVDRGCGCP